MVTKSITVPHANYKIEAANDKLAALENIDLALASLGFSLKENDWETWKPILEADRVVEKRQERRYSKGDFEVFYGVLYQSGNMGYIRLSFYEHDKRQFSKEGIALYYQLKNELSNRGLVHLPETPEDVKAARPVVSPEEFNKQHPLPSLNEKAGYLALIALSFLIYAVVIIVPGWLLIRKVAAIFSINTNGRRCVFILLAALVLFPAPMPMSMFGPVFLVPGVLMLPFVFGLPEQFIHFITLSVGFTLVLSCVAALWLIKPSPNNALHRTSR
ncbi:hypothetical protein [Arsukibacterium sp.]|uniref:hypothetical protein n=1 Tax=Arsukibacterium sp. TaxID=1977258 RepID=UPI002FDB54CC